MKEITFLRRNLQRWQEFEKLIESKQAQPDYLSELYIQLSDDLAYSQTYFPNSDTTLYLNSLAVRAHHLIYKNKKIKQNRLSGYWLRGFPLLVYSIRKELFYSFLIFAISVFIGILSTKYDNTFVRLILGDSYVNMTIENIKSGDPMAVYKKMNQVDMFLGISLNNIYVSFLAFVFGIFFSLGTGYILLRNGIMLGAFQYFFYQQGLFLESFSTIWIHGTLEIFSIIIAGAAGIILGKGILFPGTYSRSKSFKLAAIKGIKIMVGLIPFFITAAFLEGFVTRYTNLHNSIKLSIIGISVLFICYYFFILPYYLTREKQLTNGKKSH